MFDVRKKMTIKEAQPETPQISKIESFATTVDKIKWNTEKLKILRVLRVMFWTLETFQFAEDFNFFCMQWIVFWQIFCKFFHFSEHIPVFNHNSFNIWNSFIRGDNYWDFASCATFFIRVICITFSLKHLSNCLLHHPRAAKIWNVIIPET